MLYYIYFVKSVTLKYVYTTFSNGLKLCENGVDVVATFSNCLRTYKCHLVGVEREWQRMFRCCEVKWPSPRDYPCVIPLRREMTHGSFLFPFLVLCLRRIRARVISLRRETTHGSLLRGGSFYFITMAYIKGQADLNISTTVNCARDIGHLLSQKAKFSGGTTL